jgi:peptidoglycan hydrolase-like protein with peptidoglycan-binding domain
VGRPKAPRGASKTLKTIVTYSGRGMSKGSRYPAVKAVQKAIGARQTGTYSAATVTRMKAWQSDHGLTPTGKLGYATWRALERSLAPRRGTGLTRRRA